MQIISYKVIFLSPVSRKYTGNPFGNVLLCLLGRGVLHLVYCDENLHKNLG